MLSENIKVKNGRIVKDSDYRGYKTTDQIYKGFSIYKTGSSEFTAKKETGESYTGGLDEVKNQIDKFWEKEDAKEVLNKDKKTKDGLSMVDKDRLREDLARLKGLRNEAKAKGKLDELEASIARVKKALAEPTDYLISAYDSKTKDGLGWKIKDLKNEINRLNSFVSNATVSKTHGTRYTPESEKEIEDAIAKRKELESKLNELIALQEENKKKGIIDSKTKDDSENRKRHIQGLRAWYNDYKKAKEYGNTKLAGEIMSKIERQLSITGINKSEITDSKTKDEGSVEEYKGHKIIIKVFGKNTYEYTVRKADDWKDLYKGVEWTELGAKITARRRIDQNDSKTKDTLYDVTINRSGENVSYKSIEANSEDHARTKCISSLEKKLGMVSGSLQKEYDGSKLNVEVKKITSDSKTKDQFYGLNTNTEVGKYKGYRLAIQKVEDENWLIAQRRSDSLKTNIGSNIDAAIIKMKKIIDGYISPEEEETTDEVETVGKHNDIPDSEFDPEELAKGIEIEKEHTDDIELAKAIAKDHLREKGQENYYSYLLVMEKLMGKKIPLDMIMNLIDQN